MKLMAVIALACGITAAPMVAAPVAAAEPGTCDGVACVPYVDLNIVPTDYCQFSSRFPLGIDAAGDTFVCAARNQWVPVAPLVGVRTMRAPCDEKVPGYRADTLRTVRDMPGTGLDRRQRRALLQVTARGASGDIWNG